jgi:glutathione S-transferase
MTAIEILGFPQSDFVWAVRLAAEEKGVPYTLVPAAPHSPEVLAVHPFGKVPVLRHGDVTLGESRAICGYIDAAFDGPALMPREPVAAARVEQWVSLLVTTIEPVAVRQYLFAYLFPGTADGAPDRARIDAALPVLERQLAILDRAVDDGAIGGAFTLADAYLVPILFYLKGFPESAAALARLPALAGCLERALARPSVQATIPPPLPGR